MPAWLGLLGILVLPAGSLDTSASVAISAHGEVSLVQRDVTLTQSKPELVVYYINTDDEEKRRAHMEQQGRAAKMTLHRFKAIDRNRVSSGEFDQKYVKKQNLASELLDAQRQQDHVPNATVACYVSHSELLEMLHRQLRPGQIAIVLEDDVEIPHNWQALIDNTLDCAPSDWSLLKVSGWGFNRASDLQLKPGERGSIMNSSSLGLMSWLQSQGGWMSRILYGAPTRKGARQNATSNHRLLQTAAKVLAKSHPESSQSSLLGQLEKAFQQEFGHDSHGETPDDRSCPDAYLMRTPFKETFWWHFWGPAYHYAGTGAYIVKADSIPAVLAHLQSQPISDIDGMLLSQGDLRAYELWPHVFPLTGDHMKSTMLDASQTSPQSALIGRLSELMPPVEEGEGREQNLSKREAIVRTAARSQSKRKDAAKMSGKLSTDTPR